jgi:hypothetical protein
MIRALLLLVLVACGAKAEPVDLSETWPSRAPDPDDYKDVTENWTRKESMRGEYQETLEVAATIKSPEWRAVHAARDAKHRMLEGAARDQRIAQAQAEMAGPYEVELMVTTWDRRENDLDRGERSVWRVRLIDDAGNEIAPIEIVKDKRPANTVRADFPALGDFATPYIARFPRDKPIMGPGVKLVRLRMSSSRGGLELAWQSK